MIKAISLQCSIDQFDLLLSERSIALPSKLNGEGDWMGVYYLVLCSAHSPSWVAKVEEIVAVSEKKKGMFARISEVRSLSGINITDEYQKAFESYRYDGAGAKVSEFPDSAFYTCGDPVSFKARPMIFGPLSMDKAIEDLADSYGVDPEQIEIIIRSKPATSFDKLSSAKKDISSSIQQE